MGGAAQSAERGASVILPCCGSEGYLRRSPTGHAAFRPQARRALRVEGGETIHHLKAKADIVIACQRAGYPR